VRENRPGPFGTDYRFFFVRRLFLWVGATGTSEKVDDVRIAGSIGATLVVVLTLILPAGVSVVLVRIRMGISPQFVLTYRPESLPPVG
jgi:hypothetical protein